MSKSLSFTRSYRERPVNRLIILSIISILLMVLDNRYAAVRQLKAYLATALQPLQWLADQPVALYDYGSTFLQSQQTLIQENQRLQTENMRLSTAIRQNDVQQLQLAELKKLNLLVGSGIGNSTAAQIVSNGKNPLSDKLLLNKGSNDGLKAGDAVIDQYGLIGQISAVQPFNAELTVLTSSQTVVPVMVARTGVRSLVYGDSNQVSLRYFPLDADLQPGDLLVTSGMDSVYPAGIPVAKVESALRSSGTPYYRTTLSIPAAIHSSKYVLVLPQIEELSIQTASSVAASSPQ